MVDNERPPPAPAPMMAPDNTPATVEAGQDNALPAASPADSETTVIAHAPPRLRRLVAQPGTGAAVFSTDGGRLPRRNPPIPPPSVVVRSDTVKGVIDFANYWRKKCPDLYPCFFPNCGWTITDLWDNADIHVESPSFLEEVLHFIVHDNAAGATNFAKAWCRRNHDKMDKLAGDISHLYHPTDQFSIVDEFFTHGEQDECPRQFLFHALWALRRGMHSYMSKYHAAQPVGSVGPLEGAEPLSPTVREHAVVTGLNQLPPMSIKPQPMFAGSPFSAPGLAQSMPNGPVVRQSSFPASQLHRPFLHEGDHALTGHHAAMTPGQFTGQLRPTKRRDRSGSNPYAQTPQMHGFGENVRMPSGEHMRHPSGPPMNGAVHRYGPHMPMGPSVPLHAGARFPRNTSMTPPPIHTSQMEHMHMMPRAAMFSPPLPHPLQLHDPAYQQYGPNMVEPRVGQLVDMVNNIQYAPVRSTDTRGIQRRNSQSVKPSGLFNPYGAERPDKAGFTTTGPRKGSRGNYSNNASRGRKYSAGTFDRSLYGAYPSECPENAMKYGNGQFNEGPQARYSSNNYIFEADPSITNDQEFGCGYDFIGPKNNTVRQLYVKNLPDDVQGDELRTLFQERVGVHPIGADIKLTGDNKDFMHAFIIFETTDDARKALNVKNLKLRDQELQVSVARRYFHAGVSSHHYPRGTFQESRRPADIKNLPVKPPQYSPQDARSDLHFVSTQQPPDNPGTRGSPEARKAKRSLSGKKTHIRREDQQNEATKVASSSATTTSIFNADDSMKQAQPLAQGQNNGENTAMDISEVVEESSECSASEAPVKVTTMETVAEESVVEASEDQQAPQHDSVEVNPGSILESLSTESRPPFLSSPTKVALPLPAGQVQVPHKEPTVTDSPSAVTSIASAQDETPSDDDQKNDLSFHSAHESQPDGDDEARRDPCLRVPNIEEEVPTEVTHKDTQHTRQHHECSQPNDEHDVANLGVTMLQGPRNKDIAVASGTVRGELGKKQGAKQVESLNPYSKTSRAQQKKEKLAKKKEKSKEKKKEKAEATDQTEVHAEDKLVDAKTSAQDYNTTKEPPAHDEQNEKYSGKHLRGASFVAPTPDPEAQRPVDAEETRNSTLDLASTFAESREKVGAKAKNATATAATSSQFAVPQSTKEQPQELEKKSKMVPSQIAVPSLELLNRKSSPTSAATPPHTAFFSVTSPTSKEAATAGTCHKTLHSQQELAAPPEITTSHDSASIASSITLRGPSPPPMSLSPTAKEFHTPLQTPTNLNTATEAGKKNKKKKKSKKKTGITEGAPSGHEEPFHDQLSQIANTQTGYYALRGSDLPAQEVLERREDKGPKGLIRQVHAYMKEKAASYARVPESTWNKDDRKPVDKVTQAESEYIMSGYGMPVSRGMKYYAQKCVLSGDALRERTGNMPHLGE